MTTYDFQTDHTKTTTMSLMIPMNWASNSLNLEHTTSRMAPVNRPSI